ncbi:MAG: potassium transporter TrkA [Sulfurimonas sp.]|nr:potassium transporter TrkA [Sulfurimonas sp.]
MKKILIISDGDVGDHFMQRVIQTHSSENIYYIVEQKVKEYKDVNPARFKFYNFDPTSFSKLSNLLKMEFIQVIIVMDNLVEIENTIKNIKLLKIHLRIIVLTRHDLKSEDNNVVIVDSNEILASRLLDYLPDVPVIAQNVGLGEGEIMEVLVPFGSSFVYKHIGVIEQKHWRIVAIYRNRKLLMPSRSRMIQPNDQLVLVGEPAVLKSVYRAIKRELGEFPEPFGSNLYLYVDMTLVNLNTIEELIARAVFAHKKFKHDLIIKVVNPNSISILQYIKGLRDANVIVEIEYKSKNLAESFFKDIKSYHIGLVIVSSDIFANDATRKRLYESHVPILKLSNKPVSSLKEAAIILGDNRDLEKISATIFDISEQLGFNLEIYNYMNEHQEEREEVVEHYYNLATIFSKNIKVIKETQNPIRIFYFWLTFL